MANLNSNILVTVSLSATRAAAANFGTPLYVAQPSTLGVGFVERIRYYNDQSEADADTDLTTAARDAVAFAFAQNPRVASVAIGKPDADVAQVSTGTVGGAPLEDDVFAVEIDGVEVTYTVQNGDTVADVATGIASAIEMNGTLGPLVAAVATGGGAFTVTHSTAGGDFVISGTAGNQGGGTGTLSFVETTPAVNIKTSLSAILAESGDWYGFAIFSRDATQIERAAAWSEANKKLFVAQTADAAVLAATAGNILETLSDRSYRRTALLYHADSTEAADLAWLGLKLEADPDEETTIWRYGTLAGVTIDDLTATQIANIRNGNGNVYEDFVGFAVTDPGRTVDGNPIDLLITSDWTEARIRERIAAELVRASNRNSKIPYTDDGIGTIVAIAEGVLGDGVDAGHFSRVVDDEGQLIAPKVFAPRAATISSTDKANRFLRLTFVAEGAGAIEGASITGAVVVDLNG